MNLPFQPSAGSQTSKRMSESGVGLIEPVARQNAGSFAKSAPGPPNEGTGDLNAPAATASTPEIVVFGTASAARASQDFGAAADAAGGAALCGGSFRPHAASV